MTARPLIVVGAGGFGREVLDVVEAVNRHGAGPLWQVVGVVDDSPAPINLERLRARHIRHLGGVGSIARYEDHAVVIGVGSPEARVRIAAQLRELSASLTYPVLVHPSASIGSECALGEGAVVCGGAQISTNVSTGRHVHVNPNATIGHDTSLSDYVSVNPGAIVSGECSVESGVLIGAGAVVLQGVVVGARSLVGASACVVRDVAPDLVVKGVPAR